MNATVDQNEIAHFAKDSRNWWDEAGPFAPLHRLNPVRLRFIRDRITEAFDRNPQDLQSLKGLKILDIGCGGGLTAEPLARLGAHVTGIDADAQAIDVARAHAAQSGLAIDYRHGAAEDMKREQFDVVLALEIVEHVSDIDAFIAMVAGLCKPGGLVIMSTLNRTPKSFLLGIVAAEYVLRWVPRGTHQWKKFVRPSTLSRSLRHAGVTVASIKGLVFNPVKNVFELSDGDVDVNYLIAGTKRK